MLLQSYRFKNTTNQMDFVHRSSPGIISFITKSRCQHEIIEIAIAQIVWVLHLNDMLWVTHYSHAITKQFKLVGKNKNLSEFFKCLLYKAVFYLFKLICAKRKQKVYVLKVALSTVQLIGFNQLDDKQSKSSNVEVELISTTTT